MNAQTHINMKNLLIQNLTNENEKLKSDISGFLVNESDFTIISQNKQDILNDLI